LRCNDCIIRHEHDAVDISLNNWKNAITYATWRERIRCYATSFCIGRTSSLQSLRKRRRSSGFDSDNFDASSVPSCDPGDQTSSANRNKYGVYIGGLLLKLNSDRALAENRLVLVERMHGHRTGFLYPILTCNERVGVQIAFDHKVGAV
jgi:hypothetical protein